MQRHLLALLLLLSASVFGQQITFSGKVIDEKGTPLPYATAALLKPADSTLAYFGITDSNGDFEIKRAAQGKFLLQVAYLGYQTYYRELEATSNSSNLGALVLMPKTLTLGATEIKGEHIPILIKKDTVEYNAGAYKTKSGAVAEDLIKKLPGVSVDRNGNIKAMGEDVGNVLVDGKEFFSSDPKVATKNLPADAISKVQVYNKKSDESELSGVDDGSRDKTMNLMLKEDKKDAWFGEVRAGYGTKDHYQGNGKIYRFNEKIQFAGLAMLNNINKFGFSFQDYMDFSGGFPSFSGGGGSARINLSSDDNLPIDFGQQITGNVGSGAGGLNFSYEPKKNNRFYISYLGNGSDKKQNQTIGTRHFGTTTFNQTNYETSYSSTRSHMLNFGLKQKSDSIQNIILSGKAGINTGSSNSDSKTESSNNLGLVNSLKSFAEDQSEKFSTETNASWLHKGKKSLRLLRVSGTAAYSSTITNEDWKTLTQFINLPEPIKQNQFLDRTAKNLGLTSEIMGVLKIGKNFYFEPSIFGAINNEKSTRQQGNLEDNTLPIDSLSPDFSKLTNTLSSSLGLRFNTTKTKTVAGIKIEYNELQTQLNQGLIELYTQTNLLPYFIWENEYKIGHRLSFDYFSNLSMPAISQLLPVINNQNPLALFYGNRYLKPEKSHSLGLNWLLFDQFSQTSVFAHVNSTYTNNKISYSTQITDSLSQLTKLLNVPDDYRANGRIDFSSPIRIIGLTIGISVSETWNQGINYINNIKNQNTSLTHDISLSFDNTKKTKWDVETGVNLSFTNTKYSIQNQMNTNYLNYSIFTDISYTPTDAWHFNISADYTKYGARGFSGSISIPILNAELSYSFTKNHRTTLTLEAFDILDKNSGIQRISDLNYLREIKTNILSRYVMLTLKYRINQFAGTSGGIQIKTKRR
jgi:hypothetical protein